MLAAVTMTEVQILALSAFYLEATSVPHMAWILAGIGLRFAEELRGHSETRPDGFEHQMWKRIFWCVLNLSDFILLSLPLAVS